MSDEMLDMLVQAQMLYGVRSDRYQIHEIEYLRSLILPHDAEIQKVFNISAEDIINGMEKMQHALSQGKADAFNGFMSLFDTSEAISEEKRQEYIRKNFDLGQNMVQKMFCTSLNDVASVTSWPDNFIEKLSYGINEDAEFFSDKDYSGWPIIDLPIQKKPFLQEEYRHGAATQIKAFIRA